MIKTAGRKSFIAAAIFLLASNYCFSQYSNTPYPTQFDKFITQSNIEWAAYANERIKFEKINLNKLLFNRMLQKGIKVALPILSGSNDANYITFYSNKDTLDSVVLYPCCVDPLYDSSGTPYKIERKPLEIDTTSTLSEIVQILYVENGKLKSYIPWVTPLMLSVKSGDGTFFGYTDYFSACHNYKYNYLPDTKDELLSLMQTKQRFRLDSPEVRSKLKELYDRNLTETLWPYVIDNKLDVYTIDSKIKLRPEEINDTILSIINTVKEPIDDYYVLIKKGGFKYRYGYFDLKDFREIELVQDWYYNFTQNIVYNEIREVYLYTKKWSRKGEDKDPSPILKIVFN